MEANYGFSRLCRLLLWPEGVSVTWWLVVQKNVGAGGQDSLALETPPPASLHVWAIG